MAYTVKQLAKLSGVSSRTLRFYDGIGLLKPAYYGENQYRYYEEEQLLILQQILFFRELGIALTDIKRIMSSPDFNKIEALIAHKSILQSNLENTATLIKTIDKTIAHLRGNEMMNDAEMYVGFDPKKQQEYEDYLVEHKIISAPEIKKYRDQVKDWKTVDWEEHKRKADEFNQNFVAAMRNHLAPSAPEVQELVREHYNWVKRFWTPTKKTYIELGQLYQDHPDFREFYNAYDPQLIDYLFNAMSFFAEHELA